MTLCIVCLALKEYAPSGNVQSQMELEVHQTELFDVCTRDGAKGKM
jgi:hypothetical protein